LASPHLPRPRLGRIDGRRRRPGSGIAAAVEATESGGKVVIDGEPLASVVVLPDLYDRRGFRPAWTSQPVTDELVRAIRDSAGDGLAPADGSPSLRADRSSPA